MSRVDKLAALGQAVWFDFISRKFLAQGELDKLVAAGVRGVTSNPAIFEKAIAQSSDYDGQIEALAKTGKDVEEIYEALVVDDILTASTILMGVYEATEGEDGYVSLEVSPRLAFDTEATVAEALALFKRLSRPNVMIKVPATPQGVAAIEILVGEGVNINATLIFSIAAYEAVAKAYVKGLTAFVSKGGDPSRVASVASVFVSRIDAAIDPVLAKLGRIDLAGKAAVDNARLTYRKFEEIFSGPKWVRLEGLGARVQRPLWASTGTKNPAYPDTLYVDTLIGTHTVNTMPPPTLDAYFDHGGLDSTIRLDMEGAVTRLAELKALGVDLDEVTSRLLDEGVESFATAYGTLLASVARKRAAFAVENPLFSLGRFAEIAAKESQRAEGEQVSTRLLCRDHTLWSDSPKEISNRLGWLDVAARMGGEAEEVSALRSQLMAEGVDKALLIGMGGSSLAPEVFSRTFGHAGGLTLSVADSTAPDAIAALATANAPATTAYVVSTKSGGTVETLSLFKYFHRLACDALGPVETGRRFILITDPGSTLEEFGRTIGARKVFLNDPDIGGRYAALSLVGLVPAALMGVDVGSFLTSDTHASSGEEGKVAGAVRLGCALGALAQKGVDKLTFVISDEVAALADWIEQLVAESTGKGGKGILPVVGETLQGPKGYGADRVFAAITLKGDDSFAAGLAALEGAGFPCVRIVLEDISSLGSQFLFWEVCTAVACWSLKVNPFDQPDVESAKTEARAMLEAFKRTGRMGHADPAWAGGGVEVYADFPVTDAEAAFEAFMGGLSEGGYLALQAYMPRSESLDRALQALRERVRARTSTAVTIGYGPRFLHSTGQLHKGDRGMGRFVQFIAKDCVDLPIPDDFASAASSATFGTVKLSQALGDAGALKKAGRAVMRFNVEGDPAAFIDRLVAGG